jgi:ATP-dependent RNA helicase RhlE
MNRTSVKDAKESYVSLMTFDELGLAPPLLSALKTLHYTDPTPIQTGAIPAALEGRDVLGSAQTGTGKTAAFSLPILHRLGAQRGRGIRALILAPTRELAGQIHGSLREYGQNLPLRSGVLIGGTSMMTQANMLRRGLDIVVATPGRLNDHLRRGSVDLRSVEMLVLDEADRMLDMGFIRDIRTIISCMPAQRQTLFFTATLQGAIRGLAQEMLNQPHVVSVAAQSSTPSSVTQVMHSVSPNSKRSALLHLLRDETIGQAIVFTRTKHGANKIADYLDDNGLSAVAIHGNKSQNQRNAALRRFKGGGAQVMVATDIAARGLDIAGVSHVINFEVPHAPEDYVHRIGRTGRASATGVAISLVSAAERSMIRRIERLTGKAIARHNLEGFAPDNSSAPPAAPRGRSGPPRPPSRGRRHAA